MGPSRAVSAGMLLLAGMALEGCTLDQVVASCADCGEIRQISVRELRNEIRLPTDAPVQTVSLDDAASVPLVYDVRIHMDRGGSRDLVVSELGMLKVGDHVEVTGSRITRRGRTNTGPLWL